MTRSFVGKRLSDCVPPPSVFDSSDKDAGAPASVRSMTLETSQVLESGAVWLRYRLHSG
jgi:hypothetical protein